GGGCLLARCCGPGGYPPLSVPVIAWARGRIYAFGPEGLRLASRAILRPSSSCGLAASASVPSGDIAGSKAFTLSSVRPETTLSRPCGEAALGAGLLAFSSGISSILHRRCCTSQHKWEGVPGNGCSCSR